MILFILYFICRFKNYNTREAKIQNRSSFLSKKKRNKKLKKCLLSESRKINFNIQCNELTQFFRKKLKVSKIFLQCKRRDKEI